MSPKKKGPGRPRLPKPEQRTWRIALNFNREQYEELVEVAGERSPSDYAREVVLRHLARRRKS